MQNEECRRTICSDQIDPPSSAKAPFAFVHIPKCSGTAFENYMISQGGGFASSRAFTGVGVNGESESLEAYFKKESLSSFVFGHFHYQNLLRFCPNAFTATFVRDPVNRTISQYKSWHDENNFHPDDPHYKVATSSEREALIFAQQASLEEFVCSGNPIIFDGALGNQQTICLSTYLGGDMEEHLKSAKKNLNTFDFFGITENFMESLELLQLMIPDFLDYGIAREKENRSRIVVDEVTQHVRGIIAEQVKYDQQLYEYACQLFKERIQEWRSGSMPVYAYKWFAGENTGDRPQGSRSSRQQLSQEEYQALRLSLSRLEIENKRIQSESEQLREQLQQIEIMHLQASEANQKALEVQQTRSMEAEAVNGMVRAQLAHLEASHIQLRQVYSDIVESRSWRLMQALQSVLARFHIK